MKTAAKFRAGLLIVTAIALLVAGGMFVNWLKSAGKITLSLPTLLSEPEPTVDPHEGQVYIDDGFGMVWMTPLEGVDVNCFTARDFKMLNGELSFVGSGYDVLRGVDVSEHQHEIDWARVKASGIDFAIVRVAYRGYTQGGLFKDAYADYNLREASRAGLKLGVYFFSQAITPEEAAEEAEYLLEAIKNYDVSFPVVYDWEPMTDIADARTNGLDSDTLNDCAIAFCETVKAAGYQPCVYFNRHLGYYRYDLSRLTDYMFWVSVPGDHPDFYYAADIWQYSFTENIPGIQYENDVNLMFIPQISPTPTPAPETSPSPKA